MCLPSTMVVECRKTSIKKNHPTATSKPCRDDSNRTRSFSSDMHTHTHTHNSAEDNNKTTSFSSNMHTHTHTDTRTHTHKHIHSHLRLASPMVAESRTESPLSNHEHRVPVSREESNEKTSLHSHEHTVRAWTWWRSLGSPRHVCAPMVCMHV